MVHRPSLLRMFNYDLSFGIQRLQRLSIYFEISKERHAVSRTGEAEGAQGTKYRDGKYRGWKYCDGNTLRLPTRRKSSYVPSALPSIRSPHPSGHRVHPESRLTRYTSRAPTAHLHDRMSIRPAVKSKITSPISGIEVTERNGGEAQLFMSA